MEATVNLILPLTVTVRIDPQPSSIVHLNEFGIQILAGLSDGRDENNISSVYAAQSLAGFERDEISNAIKDLAIESASELAANLLPRVESKLQVTPEPTEPVSAAAKAEEAAKDVAKVLDSSSQPTEAAEQQVRDYLGGFIDKNLGKFYGGNTSKVEELATQAVSKAKDVAAEFQIPTNSALMVAELALYNFIILCDDSGSMNANDAHLSGSNSALNRIPAMKDAVLRFFNIATAVNPEQGIHLRFFDSPQISQTDGDKLTSEAIVTQTLDQCCFDTGWGVPQPLQQKILLPLLEKAKKDELTAPTVVIIITDGGASQSETNELVTYLVDFKKSLNDCGYSGPAVVFLFCRVGYDPAAEAFLGTLSSSEEIQDIICCYKEELGVKEQNQDKAFTGELVEQLILSLGTQIQ